MMFLISLIINWVSTFKWLLLAIIVAVVISIVFGLPLIVSGGSMNPTLESGDLVLVEKLTFSSARGIKRGDVVAARFPADPQRQRLVKRVIGLPSEKITIIGADEFLINGSPLLENYSVRPGQPPYQSMMEIELSDTEYFLAGDNRPNSSDSRQWGAVKKNDIFGRAAFILYPIGRIKYIN